MNRHPSELALEAYLLDRETSPVAPHLGGCEHCRARVARMEHEGEDFRRFVLPATLDAVLEKNAPERRKRWLWLLGIAPVAAVAALIVAILPSGEPPVGYVGVKGGMSLVAYLGATGGAKIVLDGQAVKPSGSSPGACFAGASAYTGGTTSWKTLHGIGKKARPSAPAMRKRNDFTTDPPSQESGVS